MRNWALVVSVLTLLVAAGCNGVVRSADDREFVYGQVAEMDARQMADDWDVLWLAHRQSRLTRWQTR